MAKSKRRSKKMLERFQGDSRKLVRSRKDKTRNIRLYYLIVCEGEKSEPNYFKAIKKQLPPDIVDVDVSGEGANTQTIVNIAKIKSKKRKNTTKPYDKVWVVFDKDSFPATNFDNAIHSAKANNFDCAWSNEAFELWYLLHFEFRHTAMSRKKYKKALSAHLGEEYKKNDPDMYRKLIDKQDDAIINSEKLLATHCGITPSSSNPATKVHLLVKELNEYKSQK